MIDCPATDEIRRREKRKELLRSAFETRKDGALLGASGEVQEEIRDEILGGELLTKDVETRFQNPTRGVVWGTEEQYLMKTKIKRLPETTPDDVPTSGTVAKRLNLLKCECHGLSPI